MGPAWPCSAGVPGRSDPGREQHSQPVGAPKFSKPRARRRRLLAGVVGPGARIGWERTQLLDKSRSSEGFCVGLAQPGSAGVLGRSDTGREQHSQTVGAPKSSKPQAVILPNTNVTSNLIPRSLTNLRTNTQMASSPKELASASPAGSAKYLEEGQNFAEATNPLHFFGLKYLASSKVLSPGQGIDSNDLTKRPKAELC